MRMSDWSSDVCASDLECSWGRYRRAVAIAYDRFEGESAAEPSDSDRVGPQDLVGPAALKRAFVGEEIEQRPNRRQQPPTRRKYRGYDAGRRPPLQQPVHQTPGLDIRDRQRTRRHSSHYCATPIPSPPCKK